MVLDFHFFDIGKDSYGMTVHGSLSTKVGMFIIIEGLFKNEQGLGFEVSVPLYRHFVIKLLLRLKVYCLY